MKNTKRVFGVYAAWDYTHEIDDLNKMSEKGWQLTKGGLFSNCYKKNDGVRYRYQIDFNNHIDEMARYIETFREQGWEYINSTWNDWHYFRKLYDSNLPAEEYEIYNDNQSLKEMQGNWKKTATSLAVLLGICSLYQILKVISAFRFPNAILAAILLTEFIMVLRGAIAMKNPKRSGKGCESGMKISSLVVAIFIGLVITLAGLTFREDGIKSTAESYKPVSAANPVDLYKMKISYPDFYHFTIKGELGASATFTLKNNEAGDVIFTERVIPDSDGKFYLKKKMNFLKRGKYNWYFSEFAGGKMNVEIDVE